MRSIVAFSLVLGFTTLSAACGSSDDRVPPVAGGSAAEEGSPDTLYYQGWVVTDGNELLRYGIEIVRVEGRFQAHLDSLGARPDGSTETLRLASIALADPDTSQIFVGGVCSAGDDIDSRIIGLVHVGSVQAEWYTDIRLAWIADLENHRIRPLDPTGVRCGNESWGL